MPVLPPSSLHLLTALVGYVEVGRRWTGARPYDHMPLPVRPLPLRRAARRAPLLPAALACVCAHDLTTCRAGWRTNPMSSICNEPK